MVVLFVVGSIIFLATIFGSSILQRSVVMPKKQPKLNIVDKLGMSFEMALTNIFTEMGTLFARYPIPVIFLSIGFAVGLSAGILWLDVTTDPIELWASPESRSRIEKDFFDKTFRPFYRTEQIIIKAKNLSSYEYKDFKGYNTTF